MRRVGLACLGLAAALLLQLSPVGAQPKGPSGGWFRQPAAGPDVATVLRWCSEAHTLLSEGRANEALKAVRQALDEAPTTAPIHLLEANVYAALNQSGNADAAQEQADEVTAVLGDPQLWRALLRQTWITGELESAVKRWPDNVTAHLALAIIGSRGRTPEKGAEHARFVMEHRPQDPALRALLAGLAPRLLREAERALLAGERGRAAQLARLTLQLASGPASDDLMWATTRAHELLVRAGAETKPQAAASMKKEENSWAALATRRFYAPLLPPLLALASLACWILVAVPCCLGWLAVTGVQWREMHRTRVPRPPLSVTRAGVGFVLSVAGPVILGTALGFVVGPRWPLAPLLLLSPVGVLSTVWASVRGLREGLRVPEEARHVAGALAIRALALTYILELVLAAIVAFGLSMAAIFVFGWQVITAEGGGWSWISSP